MNTDSNAWAEALNRHAVATRALVKTARAIDLNTWSVPMTEGKWTPAQVVDHLNKTYQVVTNELKGGQGIRVRSPWLLRQVLRQTVLRSIYRKRSLPKGARAPAEVRPDGLTHRQSDLIERFGQLAAEFEETARIYQGQEKKLSHHIFGEINLLKGIDFIAIHVEHHHRQIAGVKK